jgi:hypothetical protein
MTETSTAEISRRESAKASLCESWRLAQDAGLDHMSDEEIYAEIAAMRKEREASDAGITHAPTGPGPRSDMTI